MDEKEKIMLADGYQYLLEKLGKEIIVSRYGWVYDLMRDFIEAEQLMDDVMISSDILNHVVVDYFVDIDRLKEFQNIEKVHDSKIYAYLSFWILRHKPIQIVKEGDADRLSFINEAFVCCLLRSYLFSEPENIPIMNNKKEVVDNFVETLLYYLKYRDYSAKNIEMILLAFAAGRGYQYSVDYQNA